MHLNQACSLTHFYSFIYLLIFRETDITSTYSHCTCNTARSNTSRHRDKRSLYVILLCLILLDSNLLNTCFMHVYNNISIASHGHFRKWMRNRGWRTRTLSFTTLSWYYTNETEIFTPHNHFLFSVPIFSLV